MRTDGAWTQIYGVDATRSVWARTGDIQEDAPSPHGMHVTTIVIPIIAPTAVPTAAPAQPLPVELATAPICVTLIADSHTVIACVDNELDAQHAANTALVQAMRGRIGK